MQDDGLVRVDRDSQSLERGIDRRVAEATAASTPPVPGPADNAPSRQPEVLGVVPPGAVPPATAPPATAPPAPGAATRTLQDPEVAGAVEPRAPAARPARIEAPPGFTTVFLREAPATSARALASLPNGTAIEILPDTASGDGFTWLHVRTTDGVLGWIVSTAVAA